MLISWFLKFLGREKTSEHSREAIEEIVHPSEINAEIPEQPYQNYSDFCLRMESLVEQYCSNFSNRISKLEERPLISIILPVYDPEPKWLETAIESVIEQIYPDWELCIADDCSSDPRIRQLIENYSEKYDKIRADFREQNGHISEASNSALAMATGEFVALLDHDDFLPKHALARVIDCINDHPKTDII